ncbi:hypothetical protein [Variovorax sp. 38R]|uniref:hypothetical protein n=1 Tax=Variovorax sp. 38R TaxID=2774875 RepID=UPI00177C61DF|nr:hypothetical protein [Variovorax sp. 38R]QOF76186.1 hypothetical protein IG196_17500 [Variovorax sp. 38R]
MPPAFLSVLPFLVYGFVAWFVAMIVFLVLGFVWMEWKQESYLLDLQASRRKLEASSHAVTAK